MKMSLLDLSWFLLESEAIPVHGGFLYVFSPPAGAKADYADKLFNAMRKRPVGAPFNLRPKFSLTSMPQWEKVGVDLADHVFRERLPAPGTERQLFAAAAKAVNPPVASSAPLWRFNWFDGLQGGRFAFMLTVHHAQWDGIAMFRLMGETLPDSPKVRTVRAPWEGLSTWHRPDVPKEKRPAALAKATNATTPEVTAVSIAASVGLGAGLGAGNRVNAAACQPVQSRPDTDPHARDRVSRRRPVDAGDAGPGRRIDPADVRAGLDRDRQAV
jgi:hypothetical protein